MPDADLVVEVLPEVAQTSSEGQDAAQAGAEKAEVAVAKTDGAAAAAPAIEPIADLKAQLDALTAQKAETERDAAEKVRRAEAQAAKAAEEAARAKAEVTESNVSAVDSAIHAAKAAADGFQREQQAAFEAGDFAKAAEYGRKMAREEAKVTRLEEGKADLEALKREKPAESRRIAVDPLEAALANTSPRSAAWLRAHPQYITDEKLARRAQIADLEAVDSGLLRDTDAYFDFCERKLGLKTDPKPNGAEQTQQKPAQQAKPMPGAPPSRDGSPGGGQLSPTQVTLTPGEQRAASDGTLVWNYNDPKIGAVKGQPIGVREMARRKLAMTKQGLYDRSFTEQ